MEVRLRRYIDGIYEESKENSTFGGRVGTGVSRYVTRDYKNDKVTVFHTLDGALQITNPDLDTSLGFSFFPFGVRASIANGATIIKKEELTFYEYNKKYHPRGGKNGY